MLEVEPTPLKKYSPGGCAIDMPLSTVGGAYRFAARCLLASVFCRNYHAAFRALNRIVYRKPICLSVRLYVFSRIFCLFSLSS